MIWFQLHIFSRLILLTHLKMHKFASLILDRFQSVFYFVPQVILTVKQARLPGPTFKLYILSFLRSAPLAPIGFVQHAVCVLLSIGVSLNVKDGSWRLRLVMHLYLSRYLYPYLSHLFVFVFVSVFMFSCVVSLIVKAGGRGAFEVSEVQSWLF